MQWRQIGPFRGGRALAIEGVPGEPDTYYFGGVAGGVWKTVDGGANWTPLFDKEDISSIGAIAVAASDHNVVYAGTGEAAIRGNTTYGIGVYKSIDAGKTWKNVGLKDSHQIGALIVDPRNADIVLVAALGHAFGPNQERGIFRTADGGKTWTKVLSKDENTGGIDVVFDPHNPNIVFAALWQARRQPWFFSSGGPGSGLYRSEDNGVTWKHIEGNGLPERNSWERSASPFRAPIRIAFTRSSRRRKAGFIARMMPANIGPESTTMGVFASAPGISAKFTRIRNPRTQFIF